MKAIKGKANIDSESIMIYFADTLVPFAFIFFTLPLVENGKFNR